MKFPMPTEETAFQRNVKRRRGKEKGQGKEGEDLSIIKICLWNKIISLL